MRGLREEGLSLQALEKKGENRMIRFNSDYSEGAHERILKKLIETNLEQTPGYGEDEYCHEAAAPVSYTHLYAVTGGLESPL